MSETAEAYKKAVQFFMDEFIAPALEPRIPTYAIDENGNNYQQPQRNPYMELEHIKHYQTEFEYYMDRYF